MTTAPFETPTGPWLVYWATEMEWEAEHDDPSVRALGAEALARPRGFLLPDAAEATRQAAIQQIKAMIGREWDETWEDEDEEDRQPWSWTTTETEWRHGECHVLLHSTGGPEALVIFAPAAVLE